MKEVIAVVRMNMMNRTKAALSDAGIAAYFAHEAQGRGKGFVNPLLIEGAKKGYEEAAELLGEKGKLYPKRMVSVVIEDDQVDEVVAVGALDPRAVRGRMLRIANAYRHACLNGKGRAMPRASRAIHPARSADQRRLTAAERPRSPRPWSRGPACAVGC